MATPVKKTAKKAVQQSVSSRKKSATVPAAVKQQAQKDIAAFLLGKYILHVMHEVAAARSKEKQKKSHVRKRPKK
jgi:hypothetical protein